ncbi:ENV2 protein, partial [Loxia leucoptera]|nr:ENV2 protein [Loxia leucoptera]
VSFFLQDWICGRPCNPYACALEESEMPWRHPGLLEPKNKDQPSDILTAPEGPVRAKMKWQRYLCIILLLGFVGTADAEHYPHQPFKWVLRHLSGDKAIQEAVVPGSPSFKFKLRDIFPSQMGFPNFGESSLYQTYWCPASNPGKSYCNYPGYGYCGYWGCETIVTSDRWQPQQPDMFLQVNYAPSGCREPKFAMDGLIYTPRDGKRHTCTSYNMTILQPTHKSWATGKVWSVFVRAFRDHWVNVQIIRLPQVTPISLGPNPILAENRAGKRTTVTVKPTHGTHAPNSTSTPLVLSMPKPASYDPFFNMLNATFLSLNQSNPDLTESCWLCYDSKPPFYEGVALNVSFNYSTLQDPPQCRWDTPRRGITLSQITG